MIHLLYTIGISGSGKSTWAVSKKLEGWTVIERDEIREQLFPGYWKQKPDNKKEKLVTGEMYRQIKAALESGVDKLIFSDTNLNPKYIDETNNLIRALGYEIVVSYQYFDDSFDLKLCVDRNRARERRVPEGVICEQWRRYQSLKGSKEKYGFDTKDRPILFVSDLHGEYSKLVHIAQEYNEKYTIVLLGDLNDQRYENLEDNFSRQVSSFYTVKYVKARHETPDFGERLVCLQSNHQKNLINLIRNKRKKLGQGLQHTAAEFVGAGLLEVEGFTEKDSITYIENSKATEKGHDIANFLDTLPACLRVVHNGEEWRASHAFVPEWQSSFEPFPRKNELFIYGPKPKPEPEVLWWEEFDRNYSNKFKIIAGHSHHVYMGNNVIINDPDEQGRIGLVFFEDGKEPRFEEFN
jgi:predicted kinase